MKARALVYVSLSICLILLLTMQLADRGSVAAQDPPATYELHSDPAIPPRDGLLQAPDGTWYRATDASDDVDPVSPLALQATGGPDDFGYTWDDSVIFDWFDATTWTDTGIGGDTIVAGPFYLPFSFQFYEKTYTHLYVSKHGYVGFTNDGMTDSQQEIPDGDWPNSVIAAYWAPLLVNEDGYAGRVYYTTGGIYPDRYVVVEWHEARGTMLPDSNVYTFQVVIYENGDILIQHADMLWGSSWMCGHVGIEDSLGLDALPYGRFCQTRPSNVAIRFHRPEVSARVGLVAPSHSGEFVRPGMTTAYGMLIRNTGDLGADTYDLSVDSPWPTAFYV